MLVFKASSDASNFDLNTQKNQLNYFLNLKNLNLAFNSQNLYSLYHLIYLNKVSSPHIFKKSATLAQISPILNSYSLRPLFLNSENGNQYLSFHNQSDFQINSEHSVSLNFEKSL